MEIKVLKTIVWSYFATIFGPVVFEPINNFPAYNFGPFDVKICF